MDNLNIVNEKQVEVTTLEKKYKYINPLSIFLIIYLLLPILSVEGLISWSIGALGAYKTIKIYRSDSENKNFKAIKLLLILLTITVIFNILVYYITKIIIWKVL